MLYEFSSLRFYPSLIIRGFLEIRPSWERLIVCIKGVREHLNLF